MPAVRPGGSSHASTDGRLGWKIPVEPNYEGGVLFSANQTLSEPYRPESDVFPSASRRPKKAKNHIPRPPNAFILFRSAFIKNHYVSTNVEANSSTLSKIIGLTWHSLPEDEKLAWHKKAQANLEEHKCKFPEYKFQPVHVGVEKQKVQEVGRKYVRAKNEKRRVREVEQKDLKRCEKIAELLVTGKRKEELELEIQVFDRTHVPGIVTRFKEPLTEESFWPANDKSEDEEFTPVSLPPSSSGHPPSVDLCSTLVSSASKISSPVLVSIPQIPSQPTNPFLVSAPHKKTRLGTNCNQNCPPYIDNTSSGLDTAPSLHANPAAIPTPFSYDLFNGELHHLQLVYPDFHKPTTVDPPCYNFDTSSSIEPVTSCLPGFCPPLDPFGFDSLVHFNAPYGEVVSSDFFDNFHCDSASWM